MTYISCNILKLFYKHILELTKYYGSIHLSPIAHPGYYKQNAKGVVLMLLYPFFSYRGPSFLRGSYEAPRGHAGYVGLVPKSVPWAQGYEI